jgi:CheB methylesterase
MIVACRLAGKGRAGGGVVLMCAVLMCAVLMCAVLMRAVLMTVASGRLVLASRRNSMLLIDCFLRSLAANRGEVAMGVILSGTGADGTAGVEAVNTGVASPSRVSEGRSCS